jgi:hypothetical protein
VINSRRLCVAISLRAAELLLELGLATSVLLFYDISKQSMSDLRTVPGLPNITRMTIPVTNAGAMVGLLLTPTILIAGVLVYAARQMRGSTLVAPLVWAGLSVISVCAVELAALAAGEGGARNWLPAVRFIAAVSSLCPAIALLGAKRPQSRAWQFILLTLIGILSQPAIVSLLMHYGEPVTLHAARRWFLAVLMLIGVVNYLPTRFVFSGALVCAAQALLLWGYLPGTEITIDAATGATRVWWALICTSAACALALTKWPRARSSASPWDQLWIDFRNAYGIVWSLRVEERLNASLAAAGENARLGWNGFEIAPQPAQAASDHPVETTASPGGATIADAEDLAGRPALVALLRRFVSKEWIANRIDGA